MEFRILGPLEVSETGRQLAPRRSKQRALLAILLLHANVPVATDALVEALWGHRPPDTALTALHGHVSALRKALGADRIETQARGYQLRVEPDELDLARFERLVAEARSAASPDERSKRIREALGIWHGDALAEFRDEVFARAEIDRIDELRLSALEDAIDAELALGRHIELVPELERLTAAEPLRERPRAQQMLALYRAGRQSDALHAFQEARRVLAEEVGIDPGPALQKLQREILAQDPALEGPSRPKPGEPRQERKVVTVLVAELSPKSATDPEDLQRLVEPALGDARATVRRFGGIFEQLFSNGVVGIFGAPRAHEDDPERAMRAASEMVDALTGHTTLEIRIGVERGDALVTLDGEHAEVTGDVLSVASRLQATASAGEVRAGDALQRALRAGGGSGEVNFVGRQRELTALDRAYEHVAGENSVQLVTIVGDPGSGKTRLVRQFRTMLETKGPHTWHEGRCLPYGEGVTFWALGEIVKSRAEILESDGPEASSRKLSAAVASLLDESEDRAWLEGTLSPLVGIAGAGSTGREQSFAAWRRFLEAIAWSAPAVLLFEDLHWADQALLDFVDHIADRSVGVPLLIICTARIELFETRPHWGGGKRNASTVMLPPLSADETRVLASAELAGEAPSETLISRAGGNPLFALELARMSRAGSAQLPVSLQDVIAARLDTLAPEVKEAAMDAAVVGEVFWSGALAAVAGAEAQQVDLWLHRLVAGNIVRQARRSSVARQSEYAFLHILVRDAAYNQIPKRKRALKHEAVAGWIERLAADRVSDHAELIAHHYGSALELARSAGEDGAGLTSKTCRFLVIAGDRAMSLDVAEAERLYRQALELEELNGDERSVVLARVARAAQEAGRVNEAVGLYDRAIPDLRELSDPLVLGEALVGASMALWRHGDTKRSRSALEDAVATLEREPAGPELASAYVAMARSYAEAAQPAEALEWSEKAMWQAEQLRLRHHVVRALQFRGLARCMLNDLGGLDDLRESLRLGLSLGLGFETAVAYENLGEWTWWTAGPAEYMELNRAGTDFSASRGLTHNFFWLQMESLWKLFELGEWDELLASAAAVIDWDRAQGESRISHTARCAVAAVLVRRGRAAEAKELADVFLPAARRTGETQTLAPALACAATIEAARGELSGAIQLLEELGEQTRDRSPIYRALWLPDAIRSCAAARQLELAHRLLTGCEVVAPRHVNGVLTARATLAEAEGDLAGALATYSDASTRWRQFGHVLEAGYALLGRGRCLRRTGRINEADAPLKEARGIFTGLGAEPLAAEVTALLAAAPPVTRHPDVSP